MLMDVHANIVTIHSTTDSVADVTAKYRPKHHANIPTNSRADKSSHHTPVGRAH